METAFKCILCGRVFKNISWLSRHFKWSHYDRYKCPICGMRVKDVVLHCCKLIEACPKHAVAYYLLTDKRANKKLRRKALEHVYALCLI